MRLNKKAVAGAAGLFVLITCAVVFHNAQQFISGLGSYRGVHLTDTKADVRYRLGYPPFVLGDLEDVQGWGLSQRVYYTDAKSDPKNAIPEGKNIQDFDEWSYPFGHQSQGNASTNVVFNRATNNVASVSCVNTADVPLDPCPPLAGIHFGDTEESVLQRYGKPYRFKLDGVSKTIRFDDLGVELVLVREKVYTLTLHNERGSQFDIAKRYLRSLLP